MSQAKISIVAAIGENKELGKDNKLLWHIPEDLQHFKQITTGHPIIMGRKTFQSIGKPEGLPNRLNIVLSRNISYNQTGEFPGVIFLPVQSDWDKVFNIATDWELKKNE